MKRFKEIIQSTVEPRDTNVLWLNPDINELLYYSSNGWSPVSSASKEEVENAITEHQAEMETFSEQCSYRITTLNYGANEETIQIANLEDATLTLNDVMVTNVATLYITTGGYIKEPIDLTNTPNISISGKALATFDIVRSGTGTASVGLKFKVQ